MSRLIEIPDDGIVRFPIMEGDVKVGERCIDLSDFPTVEPRKGKWIPEKAITKHKIVRCDQCGKGFGETIATAGYRFCPNCGADMRGDGNDTPQR